VIPGLGFFLRGRSGRGGGGQNIMLLGSLDGLVVVFVLRISLGNVFRTPGWFSDYVCALRFVKRGHHMC
jgi:hypothetical protein